MPVAATLSKGPKCVSHVTDATFHASRSSEKGCHMNASRERSASKSQNKSIWSTASFESAATAVRLSDASEAASAIFGLAVQEQGLRV